MLMEFELSLVLITELLPDFGIVAVCPATARVSVKSRRLTDFDDYALRGEISKARLIDYHFMCRAVIVN